MLEPRISVSDALCCIMNQLPLTGVHVMQSEVRFKQYGLKSIEVMDNGSGIAEKYHDSIGMSKILYIGVFG